MEGPAARPIVHNLYFALKPDAEMGDQVFRRAVRYQRRCGLTASPTPSERLHISLNGLGAYVQAPDHRIAEAMQAASSVRMRPFLVAFDRIASWKGQPRPLVLLGGEGVIGVSMLHAAIHTALARAGIVHGAPPELNPHLTLLRDRRESPARFIAPVSWTVCEFVLVDSLYGQGRHDILGRWLLAG